MDPEKLLVIQFDGIQVGSINVPAQEITVAPEHADRVKTLVNAVYDSAVALGGALESYSELEAKFDALEEEKKALQVKFDALEKGNPEEQAAAVKARLGLEKTAAFFKLDKASEMGDDELMKAVILSQHADLKLDEKDAAYIKARFDILSEEAAKGATGLEQLQALHKTQAPHTDNLEQFAAGAGAGEGSQGGRAEFMQKSKDAFKTPPGSVQQTILTKPAAA